MQKEFVGEKVIMGKFSYESDISEELQKICIENNIRTGAINGVGAVKKAVIGYFDQAAKKYINIELKDESGSTELEIISLIGNISIRDGKPFVHAHITLSDRSGKAYGGHLMPGTLAFAFEYVIQVLNGPDLVREFDDITTLHLWKD
jgi:predicted DNA-binding protein with PD1-like motif